MHHSVASAVRYRGRPTGVEANILYTHGQCNRRRLRQLNRNLPSIIDLSVHKLVLAADVFLPDVSVGGLLGDARLAH